MDFRRKSWLQNKSALIQGIIFQYLINYVNHFILNSQEYIVDDATIFINYVLLHTNYLELIIINIKEYLRQKRYKLLNKSDKNTLSNSRNQMSVYVNNIFLLYPSTNLYLYTEAPDVYNHFTTPFLCGMEIMLDNIPCYEEFNQLFNLHLNIDVRNDVLHAFTEQNDENDLRIITKKFLNRFNEDDYLIFRMKRFFKMGRFCPNKGVGLLPIKNTIREVVFISDKWIDIDFSKCSPVIAFNILKKYSLPCSNIETYIKNNDIVNKTILEYYNNLLDIQLTAKNIKQLINLHSCFKPNSNRELITWIHLIKTDFKWTPDITRCLTNKIITLQYPQIYKDIKTEFCQLNKLIIEHNSKMIKELYRMKRHDYKKNYNYSRISQISCNYFFYTIENHLLFQIYNFLNQYDFISNNECMLAYDGISFPYRSNPLIISGLKEHIEKYLKDTTGFEMNIKIVSYI